MDDVGAAVVADPGVAVDADVVVLDPVGVGAEFNTAGMAVVATGGAKAILDEEQPMPRTRLSKGITQGVLLNPVADVLG